MTLKQRNWVPEGIWEGKSFWNICSWTVRHWYHFGLHL